MIKAILLDIEGTTSSLSFVRDVLFPYSRERMADFIGSHLNDVEVRKLLDDARAVAGQQLNNEQLTQQSPLRSVYQPHLPPDWLTLLGFPPSTTFH